MVWEKTYLIPPVACTNKTTTTIKEPINRIFPMAEKAFLYFEKKFFSLMMTGLFDISGLQIMDVYTIDYIKV
jgi:hypothetical protein